ncbi:MAG: hypothetical protein IH623_08610 [Verrucomicrobia bacterium]|nr:hypothetical protein [Verrucomicrobiota bacterium]
MSRLRRYAGWLCFLPLAVTAQIDPLKRGLLPFGFDPEDPGCWRGWQRLFGI